MVESTTLFTFGFSVILIGVLIIVAAVLIMTTRGGKGKAKATGIIIIGPIPIIFGKDKKDVKTLLALSIVLTVALIASMIICYFLWR